MLSSVGPMAERQRDKAVIVTGAARGIGRAVAGHLARQGRQVALADIDGEARGAAASEVGRAAGRRGRARGRRWPTSMARRSVPRRARAAALVLPATSVVGRTSSAWWPWRAPV